MRRLLCTVLLSAVPRAALACPICFGQNDSPLAAGISYGIFVMLGIIAVLWVAFGSFFIYLWRRSRLAAAEGPATTGSHVPAEAGTHVRGTV